ncbi:MAG TPA: hypothetical protein PK079_24630 [Leptospiraceae bacterium]|nr:hypothetical protein [Leptospiraceae bacterium]HMW06206.1 hypothetical protein [Leptospiraceae bacterium]HMX34991.1 hypothetical protein [Leptospiraceae bacterium]HMY31668.1 hypothetical protein [Leptospiraceae bacterium]HMZ65665.1 hypothetical protein [Leptospiraceae bacterium]
MKIKSILIFLVIGLIAMNCKSMPSQGPAAKDSAVLGVKVKFNGLITDRTAARVYLVKLETPTSAKKTKDEKPVSLISTGDVIVSNWTVGNRIYYLNAQPGDYALIGAEYEVKQAKQQTSSTNVGGGVTVSTSSGGGTTIYTVFFSKDIAEKSKTTVVPGKVSVIGDITVDENKDFDKADEVQKYYGERMRPGMLSVGTVMKLFTTNKLGSLKEFNNSSAMKEEFLKDSKEDFNETNWTHLFQ